MLSFWDDGRPVYETLRKGLVTEGIVAPAFSQSEPLQYKGKYSDGTGNARSFVRSSREIPTEHSEDEEFFLAALYPGVTSDPTGRFHVPHPDVAKSGQISALAGMGLANLINAAVDVLGGSVAFRSGSYFMNVKADPKARGASGQYSVKTERRWSIYGNLVTVRLPLRKRK